MSMTLAEATVWAQRQARMELAEAAEWAAGYVARRGGKPTPPPATKPKKVTESESSTADLVAAVDPVAGSVMRKVADGTPLHQLTRDENDLVRLAFVADRHKLNRG